MNWTRELHQLLDVSQFHQESLEEEGCHLWYCWRGVLHVLLLILGGDGSWLWLRFGSLIEVALVHPCPIWLMWDAHVFDISGIHLWIDGRSDPPVPTYPFRCTFARSSQFWVASHNTLGLVENDRGLLVYVLPGRQLFCDISSTRWRRYGTVSVLQFYTVPSTMGSPLLDDVVRYRESFQSLLAKFLAGFAFNQEVSASAIDHSLTPLEKTLRTWHFRNCFAEFK